MSVAACRTWVLLRAVPRVSPLPVVVATALGSSAFLATTDNASTASTRLRFMAAAMAATVGFALDDDAATTLDSVPVTRMARRGLRALVAAVVVGLGYASSVLVADARSGVGAPPPGAVLEFVAIAAVAFGIAAVAIGRTDDGRGGRVGGAAAMVLYLSVYLPPRWWVPMTSRPESTRLLVITALGLGLWFAASVDPAMRRAPSGAGGRRFPCS